MLSKKYPTIDTNVPIPTTHDEQNISALHATLGHPSFSTEGESRNSGLTGRSGSGDGHAVDSPDDVLVSERGQDDSSSDVNDNSSRELRRKGVLAFLPDTLQLLPYRPNSWDVDPFPQLAATRYRRSSRNVEAGSWFMETIETNRWTAASNSIALFLVDPRQPSSRHFIPLLVRRLVKSSNASVRGILVIMSDDSFDHDLMDYLEHSGIAFTHLSSCSPFLTQALSWTACPALAVCTSSTGRKVSVASEEMALEWHSYEEPDSVLSAWNADSSALTWRQQTAAAIMVPSCRIQ